eukprot:5983150-Pleurochrysis_carterae.AAC.4
MSSRSRGPLCHPQSLSLVPHTHACAVQARAGGSHAGAAAQHVSVDTVMQRLAKYGPRPLTICMHSSQHCSCVSTRVLPSALKHAQLDVIASGRAAEVHWTVR